MVLPRSAPRRLALFALGLVLAVAGGAAVGAVAGPIDVDADESRHPALDGSHAP